jgi:hypothetical protein
MSVKVGDLVRMKNSFDNLLEDPGLVLTLHGNNPRWIEVLWLEDGPCMEKIRDLEVLVD